MTADLANGDRVYWADIAKGVIILVIVLSHGALFTEGAGYPQATLRNAIGVVTPIGMPLFFMISGMFSRRHLDGTWADFWNGRLKGLVWILLIWIPIDWMLFALFPNFRDPNHGKYLWQILTAWIFPSSYLWFIWSLVSYSVLSKAFGRRNALLWGGGAFCISLAMLGLTTWHLEHYGLNLLARDYYLRSSISCFFYFYFGYVARDLISRATSYPVAPALLAAVIAFCASVWLSFHVSGVIPGAMTRLVVVTSGMIGAIYAGQLFSDFPQTRLVFGRLGQMTLPIYLTHLLFMMPLVYWLGCLGSPVLREAGIMLPVAVSIASFIGSIAITALALRLQLNFFFFPPDLGLSNRIAALWRQAVPAQGSQRALGSDPSESDTAIR